MSTEDREVTLSPTERLRRKIAATPMPPTDAQGRVTGPRNAYHYDASGRLVEVTPEPDTAA